MHYDAYNDAKARHVRGSGFNTDLDEHEHNRVRNIPPLAK